MNVHTNQKNICWPKLHLRTSLVTLVDFFNLSINYSKDECDLRFQDEQLFQKDKITKKP